MEFSQNQEKKIKAFTTFFYPVLAGLEIAVFEIYSRLVKEGWDIEMYVTKNSLGTKKNLADFEIVNGIKIKRFNSFIYSLFPWWMHPNFNFKGVVCLHDFEILPGVFLCSYFIFLKIINKKKFTVILSDHGLFSRKKSVNTDMKLKIKRFIDHTLGVFLINLSIDKVHAVSEWCKEGLVNAGVKPELIIVIGNGIDDLAFSDIEKAASQNIKKRVLEFGPYLLQVGRINRVKNFEVTIKSLKLIPSKIKLVIVGEIQDKKYYTELLNLAKSLGVGDRVLFLGQIVGHDKYFLMKHALAFVHMSFSEGFGNVVIEAMSQGAVCIVSRGSALEELVVDNLNGFTLDSDNVEGLVDKLLYVIKPLNKEKILLMKKICGQTKGKRSWGRVTSLMRSFYTSSY